jgi:hypothetical protein
MTPKQDFSMIKNALGITSLAALAALVTGCASSSGGYAGAETETTYNKQLDAQRLVAVINNDDYYEIRKDNRIIVLSDAKDMKLWVDTGDIPLRLTRIGGGPNGETVVYGIAAPEKNKKEGFGSVEMFEGRRTGADKDFYAEVLKDNKWYVFGTWAELDSFRKTGRAEGLASAGYAANGEAVAVAQPVDTLGARFKAIHGSGAAPAVADAAPAPKAEAPVAAPAPAPAAKPAAKKTRK